MKKSIDKKSPVNKEKATLEKKPKPKPKKKIRTRRIYTKQEKMNAVKQCRRHSTIRAFCEESGIPLPTLNFWLKQYKDTGKLERTRAKGWQNKTARKPR